MKEKKVYTYPVRVGRAMEYALFDHFKLCPSARYVGGTSNFLCECMQPENCAGVKAVKQDLEDSGYTVV